MAAATLAALDLTEAHRQAQLRLRAEVVASTLLVWRSVDIADLDRTWPGAEQILTALVAAAGHSSAGLAASYYDRHRAARRVAGKPTPRLAAVDPRYAAGSLRYSGLLKTRDLLADLPPAQAAETAAVNLAGDAGRIALNAGRQTLLNSVAADPEALGWARVTDGAPCAFCAMLASRGPVYGSRGRGGFSAHVHCGCNVQPVYSRSEPWPGRGEEFRDLWDQETAGLSGAEARRAFRRAVEKQPAPSASKGPRGGESDTLKEIRRLQSRITDPAERKYVEDLLAKGWDEQKLLNTARLMAPPENPSLLAGADSRFWDRLVDDTGLDAPVPVRDYTVQEHKVEYGHAFRVNGRAYVVEIPADLIPSPDDALTFAQARVREAEQIIHDDIGDDLGARYQRGVAFLQGRNPADSFWAQKRGRGDFLSAATGGDGGTYVWNGNGPTGSTLRHEFGHNVDFGEGRYRHGAFSARPEWKEAMAADARHNQRAWGPTEGSGRSLDGGHRITPDTPQGLTTYGQDDIVEDYAEAVRLYLYDRRHGAIWEEKGRGHARRTFEEMFPARARLLRDQLGVGA